MAKIGTISSNIFSDNILGWPQLGLDSPDCNFGRTSDALRLFRNSMCINSPDPSQWAAEKVVRLVKANLNFHSSGAATDWHCALAELCGLVLIRSVAVVPLKSNRQC